MLPPYKNKNKKFCAKCIKARDYESIRKWAKENPEKITDTPAEPSATDVVSGDSEATTEPKKFSVSYNGQRVEREDGNSLLGYKNTGALKEALVKAQLILKDRESRECIFGRSISC